MKKLLNRLISIHKLKYKFLFSYLFALLSFILLFFVINNYTQNLLEKQAVSYNNNTLSLHMKSIDSTLENTSAYLTTFLLNNIVTIDSLKDKDSNVQINAQTSLSSNLTNYLLITDNTDGLFFYAPDSETMILKTRGFETFYERDALKDYLMSNYKNAEPTSFPQVEKWIPIQLNGSLFLLQISRYQNFFVGAWYTSSTISSPIKESITNTGSDLILSYKNPNTYQEESFPMISADNADMERLTSQDYVMTQVPSNSGDYNFSMYIPKSIILEKISWFNIIFLVFIISVVILLLFTFLTSWHQMIHPIHILIQGMIALKEGQFDIRLPLPSTMDEFALLTKNFNMMSEKIQELKIAVYEEKLQKANTELQYLTLQIKPHFFLNSLSVIHSLAITKHYDLIMEMSSCLITYFRYVFKVSDSQVKISDELMHVRNYLQIQELRYRADFTTHFSIEEGLDSIYIPILSIQTFIENIIKHAYTNTQVMIVSVLITKIKKESLPYLEINICDNGTGFSSDLLTELNTSSEDHIPREDHIGIANVKQRLYNIYGNRAILSFSNMITGGAKICIHLPLEESDHAPIERTTP